MRKHLQYPILLKQEGKHSTAHYLITCDDDYKKAALNILKDFKDCGFLYVNKKTQTFEDYVLKETGLTVDAITDLSKGKTANIKVQLTKYQKAETPAEQLVSLKKQYENDNSHVNLINSALNAIKTNDGDLAYRVVQKFSFEDYEYMKIREERFDNIKYK